MSPSLRKTKLLPGIMTVGFFALALPVVAAIAAAVWLAGAAAFENIKFARCTEQVLSLIALAQEDAGKDPAFGQAQGEDIIDDLVRRGQMQSPPRNAWDGEIRASVQPLPLMRLETDLPSYACRRLALYLGKNAGDLKLQKMEAHMDGGSPNVFFDAAINPDESQLPGVNRACGEGVKSTLAITLRLR